MTDSPSDLEKKIAMLERKLEREKKARLAAEKQLEDFSWDIFKANSLLKQSLEEAQKKTEELEFLHDTSLLVVNQDSLQQLLSQILQELVEFTQVDVAFSVASQNGDYDFQEPHRLWVKGQGWTHQQAVVEALKPIVSDTADLVEQWVVTPLEDPTFEKLALSACALITIPTADDSATTIVLAGDNNLLQEERLFVLDTARGQLLTGVRRRINDTALQQHAADLEVALQSLKNTQQQLVQNEKMASLGQLAAGVAHEINNPLGFVRSNLQALKEYVDDLAVLESTLSQCLSSGTVATEVVAKALHESDLAFICMDAPKIIETNLQGINRVTEIVQALKNFSHAGEENFESVSLNEVIDVSLKVVWNQFKYQHEVKNQLPQDLPFVQGTYGQLQQVFVNLFVNAAQAMPDGGELNITSNLNDGYIEIHVTDTGMGFDDETKKQIFTPFYTTKPVGQGTGLGLSISFAIIEAHGGEMDAYSEIGVGTTFIVKFPYNS
ncbi:ATP-binding protein [Alteromonas sp. ASW11-36]|uniref:histidine kinase n=1 Tax=Alteromonas arenosi TaxID=3055817 RepID=A0ABT7SSX6_9ALTE|nr:ATP-binding protein [Alteromonas sp. ASW11-36]MDM7859300.1 ATP-binding protein [Alteromonas sp. ASW11-36]